MPASTTITMLANTGKLAGRTLFITGASRGIGKAIALKAAKDGANIVIAAKTAESHPKLPGTIYTAAKEIEDLGGKALPCIVDVRYEDSVKSAVESAAQKFGCIDIVINNASAISLTGTLETTLKKYDLMNQINARGTFLVSKLCIPYLQQSKNPHILNISPPLNMNPRWFKNHVAYTMAKYGMSMCVLGMAEELKQYGIACNALWPKTAITTAAMEMLAGKESASHCRKPDIMADAAYAMITKDAHTYTANFYIDEDVLKAEGITNFEDYAVEPGHPLLTDFFLDEFEGSTQDALNKIVGTRESSHSTDSNQIEQVFQKIKMFFNEDIVAKTQATYVFELPDSNPDKWYLDLKKGIGSYGQGDSPAKADVNFKLSEDNFLKMFSGALKPTTAFMTGKMKISGDMGKAMKLEKLMGQLKSKL